MLLFSIAEKQNGSRDAIWLKSQQNIEFIDLRNNGKNNLYYRLTAMISHKYKTVTFY